ncbi:o-succinylbenzoate synthase [Lapillicoccus sp.]|uniref:o-succinylbenzoate synthase n=1 Tax=Lapillicoccus sp. TaxID=1909287 RepID=UPI0025DF5A02|nr:o-succinylbenzoate synthase [Lapillicoccus sp.]
MNDLPPLGALLESLHVVSIPMRVPFRGIECREMALVEGPAGWGEFSPFLDYAPPEASRWLASAVESAWVGWPAPLRDRIPVNATVPAVGADDVPGVLARYDGCTTAKIKVAEAGQSLEDDVARVSAVRACLGPDARIRVDANGGWSVTEALTALGELAAYGLEYAEQPCATVEELIELRKSLSRNGIDIPIAADESIRKAEDPLRVARLGAADIIVVKVAPLGGVGPALDIAAWCALPTVVSSAIDTSVGIAAGVALAAALPALDHACGLGTVELLADDVATHPLVPVDGAIAVGAPAVDPAALARLAAPPDREQWWRERVVACYDLLAER